MTRCISTMSRNYCKELVKSIIIKLITFRGLESARIWSTFQLFSFCVFFSCFKANTHLKRQHSAILASHLLLIRGDFSMKSDRSHQHVPYVQTQSGKRGLSGVFISFERQKPWGSPSNSWSNKQTIQAVSGTSSRSEHLSNRWDTTLKFRCFTVVLAQWHCEGASRWMLLIAATLSVQALWAEWPQQVICQGRSAVTLLQVISQLETHQVALRLSQKFTAKFLTSALSALFVLRLEQELCEVHKHVHSVLETVLTVCCTSHWRKNFS